MPRSISSADTGAEPPRTAAASGRFVLRLDPAFHTDLRREAADLGLSLNEHYARVMAMHRAGGEDGGAAVVREVRRRAGGDLVGVVAYGSWARGDLADSSDIDLLVALESTLPISRSLYRAWNEVPLRWGDRGVDAHFVHVPAPGDEISSTWAEAATDGIVLFERGLDLSRRLGDIRRRIAAGELTRHMAHGQPYWVRGR